MRGLVEEIEETLEVEIMIEGMMTGEVGTDLDEIGTIGTTGTEEEGIEIEEIVIGIEGIEIGIEVTEIGIEGIGIKVGIEIGTDMAEIGIVEIGNVTMTETEIDIGTGTEIGTEKETRIGEEETEMTGENPDGVMQKIETRRGIVETGSAHKKKNKVLKVEQSLLQWILPLLKMSQ